MNRSVPDVLPAIRNASQLSPAALDMVKLLALLAMIIDHTNTVFLSPAWPVMYALGRMAFPLFTLIWAMNVHRTPERLQKRASRLWIWAVITQPVFSLALMIWPLQPASYGLAGITLAISMATVCGSDTPGVQRLAAITAVLSLICLNGLSHLLDMPAETLLLATLPTLAFSLVVVSFCRQICPEGRRRFMPRNFFYYAYAGHLGIIGLIRYTFA